MQESRSLLTKRLRLERIQRDHAETLFNAFQEPHLHRYTERGRPNNIDEFRAACEYLAGEVSSDGERGLLHWLSFRQSDAALVGKLELSYEIKTGAANLAYFCFSDFEGQGYTKEASLAVLQDGFQRCGLSRVLLEIDERNLASIGVAESLAAKLLRVRPAQGQETYQHRVYELSP